MEHGGVKRLFLKNGIRGFIYEEYPREALSGVLNGYLTAVLGICEMQQFSSGYDRMFADNMRNLKQIIPLYDSGYWSFYALDGNLSSGFYHRYVIKQLTVLAEADPSLEPYVSRFEAYQKHFVFQTRALYNKIRYKL